MLNRINIMINLKTLKNQKFNKFKLLEVLFYTFPISFILGNLILSLHLFIFLVISLFVIKKEQLNFNFQRSYWLIIIFFLYFFLSTLIQFNIPGVLNDAIFSQNTSWESHPAFKSFLLIRFLILVFIIDILFFNKIIKLKNLFLVTCICTSFVSIDVIIQYFVGVDLFGLESSGNRNSGPFGDELIAGGYLGKFSFLTFFYISELSKNKKFSLLLTFIIAIHLIGILLSGNKMPMLLFFFGSFLILIFIRQLRFAMLSGILIFILSSFFIFKSDPIMNNTYTSFFSQINIIEYFKKTEQSKKTNADKQLEVNIDKNKKNYNFNFLKYSGHNVIYETAFIMWTKQPIFGFGQKSFRIKCHEIDSPETLHVNTMILPDGCSTHPHNYYLEILSESGIIGAILLITFFIILLKNSIANQLEARQLIISEKYLLIPIILVFFLEIWPLRSTGSFFTTWNASFFWMIAGILLASNSKKI